MKTTETKRVPTEFDAELIGTVTQNYLLTTIATGDGQGARDGNEVYLRSCYGRLVVSKNPASPTSLIRMVLYTPKQQNNVLNALDFRERIEPSEQTIWMDKLVTLNADNPTKVVTIKKKWYKGPIPGMKSEWISGVGNDVLRNPVYLLLVSTEGVNYVQVDGAATIYYKDP